MMTAWDKMKPHNLDGRRVYTCARPDGWFAYTLTSPYCCIHDSQSEDMALWRLARALEFYECVIARERATP